jgi:hypothetical protein
LTFRPLLFSRHFGVDERELNRLGVFDPTLNADTLLFPDPTLLASSEHEEMQAASTTFDAYFATVRGLIAGSAGNVAGPAWKAARQRLRFPEIPGTCLGYGAGNIRGSGVGLQTTDRLMATASEIIALGIDDPDLFLAMGLFEENFGPDLIGDMVTNVCMGDIARFNARICDELGVPTTTFDLKLANGTSFSCCFATNPIEEDGNLPVILLPKDVLRDLPVALDWRGVQEVSEQNAQFRANLNYSIAALWNRKTLESKDRLRMWALSSKGAFGDLLDMIHGMDGKPYDFGNDKLGEVIWRTIAEELATKFPKDIAKPSARTQTELVRVVETILDQFRFLIEDRDLWKELYTDDGQVRLEKSAQRFLYMSALSYCDANQIDISPEADTGRGPVDFKFSSGGAARLLVELKLSKNSKLVQGFEKQLALYDKGERSSDSRYVILDVGGMGKKLERIEAIRDERVANGLRVPAVIVIDGRWKPSASHA